MIELSKAVLMVVFYPLEAERGPLPTVFPSCWPP